MTRHVPSRLAPVVQLGLLAILVLGMLHARLVAREQHQLVVPPPGSTYHLPHPPLARFTTLGYHEAAADLAWLRTIIYFGEQATVRGRFTDFERYVDLVIALDPRFRRIYHWAGVLMVYSRARIDRTMVEDSIHYLTLGVEQFPDDGEMHYMLGFNLYFEYPPFLRKEPEKAREMKLRGIDHFKQAITSGSGPAWLAPMVASLMSKQGMDELAVMSLTDSLVLVQDDDTRKKILERIKLLESRSGSGSAADRWRRFESEWKDCCAYLDMDMFLLLRPRPLFAPEAAFEPITTLEDDALDVLDSIDVEPEAPAP